MKNLGSFALKGQMDGVLFSETNRRVDGTTNFSNMWAMTQTEKLHKETDVG